MEKPTIAITMGDPAGIGPELIVKVLADKTVYEKCRPFIIGDAAVLRDICRVVGAELTFSTIENLAEARFSPPEIDVLHPAGLQLEQVTWGKLAPEMGEAVAECLRTAFELALAGEIQGIVSAPLNKEAFHLAGYDYRDELAFFADITGSADTFMMGVVEPIWTVSATEHIAFKDIVALIKKDRILWYAGQMHQVLTRVGFNDPRIAVAALNPHAGEGGLFGREEIDEIEPAVREAQARGLKVEGPVPADMVFVRALAGDFDGVVCLYHDQANIARKLQPKETGATLHMGLPVICTTTAHGTAFDKAGQGICDPGSLAAALNYAIRLSVRPKD